MLRIGCAMISMITFLSYRIGMAFSLAWIRWMDLSKTAFELPVIVLRMSETESINTVVGRCSLTRSPRKTLSISVCPDGRVELVSPLDASIDDIKKKVFGR